MASLRFDNSHFTFLICGRRIEEYVRGETNSSVTKFTPEERICRRMIISEYYSVINFQKRFQIFSTKCQISVGAPVVEESTTADPLSSVIETPEFLKAATDSQRKEFIELETNPNLPLDVKSQAMTNWAKRCGDPVNSLYTAYVAEKQFLENQENVRMSQIVSQLSPAAQSADKDVREITSDKNQTKKEMDAKVSKQLKTLPKKVYYELTFATQ